MEDSAKLETVGSFENFYKIIKEKSPLDTTKGELVIEESTIASDFKYSDNNVMSSETNTQVKNVDEADAVKVDGHYIYYVADQRIIIIDAENAENSSKVAEINYKEEKCIDFNRIYSLEGTNDTSYLMLAGVNIESNEEADIKTFLGAGQIVYSSEKNMYIATNREKYGEGYELLGSTTHILKFALEDGKITYKAEADVDGQVNNQFSMDENGEYYRIATTSGRLWNMDKSTSNNLYILNDKLEEVSKVTGLAEEEKIYSVRYVGDKAYVVTFKQTDPLFVIDLSNSANPQILGELKLPGYSTYLHPYDETHIIGFGYETKENGTRVTTDGLKMVMFDVSDFSNPQVLFKVNIGDSKYTYSELLYNHKAMLFSKEKNIIAFPLYSSAGRKTNSRAAIYEIDLDKGFTLKGEIGNITNEYLKQVERIVFVNDTYYALSKAIVKVADMKTLEVLKEFEI